MKARLTATLLFLSGAMACSFVPGTPEYAFSDFQTFETKESYIVMPLCNAGRKVVPLVNQRIQEKDLLRRRYAIGFLGVYGDQESLSILKTVVDDEAEVEYFRGDALESIFVLDESTGRSLAKSFAARTDFLGYQAKRLLEVEDASTYADAYRGRVCFPND